MARFIYGPRAHDGRFEGDVEPKPKPVGSAMWLILLLAGGLWLVIWALFATMSQ